jgi:hypothetical protein
MLVKMEIMLVRRGDVAIDKEGAVVAANADAAAPGAVATDDDVYFTAGRTNDRATRTHRSTSVTATEKVGRHVSRQSADGNGNAKT